MSLNKTLEIKRKPERVECQLTSGFQEMKHNLAGSQYVFLM